MTIRFDDALKDALDLVGRSMDAELKTVGRVVVVRDLMGRIHLAVEHAPVGDTLAALLNKLDVVCGPFSTESALYGDSMVAPDAVFESADAQPISSRLSLLERVATGADWGRGLLKNEPPNPPRATVYGIKGGVGRSTTLCVWARYLAEKGHRVLVVDLDIEAPGVSSLLLSPDVKADYGLVDWLVEDAVGNADDELLRLMTLSSPLGAGTSGGIVVAPCHGGFGDYLAKLARSYINVSGGEAGPRTFADRIGILIDELERSVDPTVVLIDSRSGIHDLAATATTRLNATTFLFAVDSPQTWDGYEILLSSWARRPKIAREVRERLQVVSAQVPEIDRKAYLERAQQHAHKVFANTLYDEAAADGDDAFNFDIGAPEAPHFPLPVYWSRAIQDWNPSENTMPPEQLYAICGQFLERATELVLAPTT